jgi:hypothetical protein
MAVIMKITVFCDVMPHGLVGCYVPEKPAASIFRVEGVYITAIKLLNRVWCVTNLFWFITGTFLYMTLNFHRGTHHINERSIILIINFIKIYNFYLKHVFAIMHT